MCYFIIPMKNLQAFEIYNQIKKHCTITSVGTYKLYLMRTLIAIIKMPKCRVNKK